MTTLDIARLRLQNQRLVGTPFCEPSEVVGWLGAVQAQDYAGAKWALGMRMRSATDNVIEQAFAQGSILRTHLLRPTWHFIMPADIRWMLALTAPRVHAANAFMLRRLELNSSILKRSNDILAKALEGGSQLTRDELHVVLLKAGIDVDNGLRLAYIVMSAELDGVICSGARRGKQFTYALLDERVPGGSILKHDAALVELARRYFTSRGPAMLQDFVKWSGLTTLDARCGLDGIKSQLEAETVNGKTYWFPPYSPSGDASAPAAILMSVYDEYVSGYKDYGDLGSAEVGTRLKALGNALNSIILVDGHIVGTWKRVLKRETVTIEIHLFTLLSAAESQSVVEAAQRYAAFLELPLILTGI